MRGKSSPDPHGAQKLLDFNFLRKKASKTLLHSQLNLGFDETDTKKFESPARGRSSKSKAFCA